jgi:ABC-type branched-subunit amino acid transport system substrate-binding protein
MSHLKRYAIITSNLGSATTEANAVLKRVIGRFAPNMTYVGEGLLPQTSTNYSAAFASVRPLKPDVIIFFSAADGPGIFMKQYATSGLKAIVMGSDFIAHDVSLAGSAMDDYYFAYDYFDAARPANAWAAHFVSEYTSRFGAAPEYAGANYYEGTFLLWELVKRVLATKGDVHSGTDLQNALIHNPTFASVYGGNGPSASTTGTLAFDLKTHAPSSRPMGVYKVVKGKPVPLATFNIGGADFKLV